MSSPFGGGVAPAGGGGSGGGVQLASTHLYQMEAVGAMRAPDSDVQGSLLAAAMTSNGLQVQLQDGAGATPLTIANAVLWSWPIPDDMEGQPVPVLNLADRLLLLALLERAVPALPSAIATVVGFCVGSNPAAASGSGFAIGLEYDVGSARKIVGHRKLAGTWTRTAATTGDVACAGAEWVPNRHSVAAIANNKISQLGTDFLRLTGLNLVDISTTITSADVIDHWFAGCYWTSTAAGTPEHTFDAELGIFPVATIRHE